MRQDGGYAQYMLTPAQFVHRIPATVDIRTAALTEPVAVVNKGLSRLENVLTGRRPPAAVVGAGPIGYLAAKMLSARGHPVAAFDIKPARLHSYEGTRVEVLDSLSALREFDVIVEATGNADALGTALEKSKAGTVLLLLGLPYGRREFSFEDVVAYDRILIGSVGSGARDFREALELLPTLELDPLLQCEYPLKEYDRAWEMVRRAEVLKAILRVSGAEAARPSPR